MGYQIYKLMKWAGCDYAHVRRRVENHKRSLCVAVGVAVLAIVFCMCRTADGDTTTPGLHAARNARYWYDIARKDKDRRYRLQHMAYARSYLDAARSLVSDVRIERDLRTNVRSWLRKIDLDIEGSVERLATGKVVAPARMLGTIDPSAADVRRPVRK